MTTPHKGVKGDGEAAPLQASFLGLGPKRLACPPPVSDSLREIRVRLKLSPPQADRLAELPRRLRWRVAALVLGAAFVGVDLVRLVAVQEELRRAGILLNQALHICHRDGVVLDASRVLAVLHLIERLRGAA